MDSLTDNDIAILAPVLKKSVSLETLALDTNPIRAAGLEILFQSAPITLRSLSLDNCGLGDDECDVVRRKIPRNLSELNLSRNSIGRIRCLVMINFLSRNDNRLQVLFLDGNPGADKYMMKRLDDAVPPYQRTYYYNIRKNHGFESKTVTTGAGVSLLTLTSARV